MEKLDIYEYTIEDIDIDGMTALSLVDFPAIEENFVLFKKDKKNFITSKNIEKNIITGPAMIPNKNIYRFDIFKGEYEVFFSTDTVKQISQQFLIDNKKDNITIDHEYNANNIYMVESWIVEDEKNDKSNALGFDLPKGTWMVSYKVNNQTILDMINDGELKGFSIESFITSNLFLKSTDEELVADIETILNDKTFTDELKASKIQKLLNTKPIDK